MWPVIKNRTINARRDRDLALDNKSISSFSQVCFLFPLFFARKILLLDQYWQNNKQESVGMSVLPTVWWYYTNFTHKQRLGSAQGILPVSWWQESVTALSATEGSGGLTSVREYSSVFAESDIRMPGRQQNITTKCLNLACL